MMAFFIKKCKSAPEKLSVFSAIYSRPRSPRLFVLRVIFRRIYNLYDLLGKGTYKCFYILPDLKTASSIISGLLVAAITNTILLSSTPLSSFKSVLTTRSLT